MPFRIFLMALLFIIYGTANAQKNYLKFSSLTVEDGLSQNTVKCVLQDRHGFIWIGTQKGLNRYNGYEFKTYLHNEKDVRSLSFDAVNCLYETKGGQLWVGTDNGLNRYNEVTNNFERIAPGSNSEKKPFKVNTLLEDHKGSLWIGASDGLYHLDASMKNFRVYRLEQGSIEVNAVHEDARGNIWAGTTHGLAKLDKSKQRFIIAIPSIRVKTITEDATGTLWAGCTTGLHILDLADSTAKTQQSLFIQIPINNIFVDKKDNLWIGTNTGLFQLDKSQQKLMYHRRENGVSNTLNHNQVNCIYQDRTGTIWIGSYRGLNKVSTLDKNFLLYRHQPLSTTTLSSDTVTSFLEDRHGNLWIGTNGGGLNLLDSITNDFLHYTRQIDPEDGLVNNSVQALCEDSQGLIWIGTASGLSHFEPGKRRFRHFLHSHSDSNALSDNVITALCEDRRKNIWVGTQDGGLACLTPGNREKGGFKAYRHAPNDDASLASDHIRLVYEDREGNLWIGTQDGGLDKLEAPGKAFIHYRHDRSNRASISSNVIYSIREDHNGSLWIGTAAGLNKFDPRTGSFKVYTQQNGLPDNHIYGILDDADFLWLSTGRGISRFNPRSGDVKNFDIKDGLQGNEFNPGACYKNSKGKMFFGGNNGFNAFFPQQIVANPYPPAVLITSFKSANREVLLDSQITIKKYLPLNYSNNSISFEFVALNYISPEKNQYAFKLEGFDENWVHAGNQRTATYTNLPAGRYVFRVKAANNDGVWNEQGTSIVITINAPFWQSWWFLTFGVCITIAAVYAIMKLRLRHQQQLATALQKQVDLRTGQLSVEKKSRRR